jgi:hypothetical protein
MAPLPPSTRSAIREWLYKFGLSEIEAAYEAAMESVRSRRAAIEKRGDLEATDGEIPSAGGLDDEDRQQELCQEASRAEELIRNAFMIALFHFFERQCVSAMKDGRRFDHKRAMDWLEQRGYSPDRRQLHTLELCVHCSKHGPGASCNRLFAQEPAFFRIMEVAGKVLPPSDDRMRIPLARLNEFFGAVANAMSGPASPRRKASPQKSASVRSS